MGSLDLIYRQDDTKQTTLFGCLVFGNIERVCLVTSMNRSDCHAHLNNRVCSMLNSHVHVKYDTLVGTMLF